MHTISIKRSDLEKAKACDSALELFDSIAKLQGGVRVRVNGRVVTKHDRIKFRYSELAHVWFAKEFPGYCGWAVDRKIFPAANLSGANLDGAFRGISDPPIPGWNVVEGCLRRA